jgi:GAF domain-containing protein
MTATLDDEVAELRRANAELQRRLDERTTERDEALERETATAEVLQVINSSPGDLVPVFEAILEKAHSLCDSAQGTLELYDGEYFRAVATRDLPEPLAEQLRQGIRASENPMAQPLLTGERFVHIANFVETDHGLAGASIEPGRHTILSVPLRQGDALLGMIVASRLEVRPFSDQQIVLLQNFAAQAVIAMENARLITETREALEQQTATAEVLQVINASPGNLDPVFDAILEKAHTLCGAESGSLQLWDGDSMLVVARAGRSPFTLGERRRPASNAPDQRLIAGESVVQIADIAAIDDVPARASAASGNRTVLFVALRRDSDLLGYITATHSEMRPFSDKQIALLESFAAQAVIAMENARLLGELRERTDDLQEALEYQTATSDVLQVISRSTFDLQSVLDTLIKTAARLCDAEMVNVLRRDGDVYREAAALGLTPEYQAFLETHPLAPGRGTLTGRVALEGREIHITDITADPHYTLSEAASLGNIRTMLGVPLLREGFPIGVIILSRTRVEPFTQKQIELVRTFADQAVIAMENARMITETSEALEQQTATAEVLGVINSSPGDLKPVFDAILDKAINLCGAGFGIINTYDGERFHPVSHRNPPGFETFSWPPPPANRHGGLIRVVNGEDIVPIHDLKADPGYEEGDPRRRYLVDVFGARTCVAVALRKDGKLLGSITAYRQEVRPFTDKQIALLENFAAQAVIAMENARLITETREALEQQTATAEVLQVINSSPGDLAPVFDAILEKAHTLCGVSQGSLQLYEGEQFRAVATHGLSESLVARLRQGYRPGPNLPNHRLIEGERFAHILDLAEIDDPVVQSTDLGGIRTCLTVALRKDDRLLGQIVAARQEVRAFSDKEIALLENFAAQAVIAMENARLITETREALEQQTATAEVLGVINASPGDLAPVFKAMLERALQLCDARCAGLATFDGDVFQPIASHGHPEFDEWFSHYGPMQAVPGTTMARILAGENVIQVADMAKDQSVVASTPVRRALIEIGGFRTLLSIALRKDEAVLGALHIYRQEVRLFTDKQIALLQNFAAQAVIAMENARLITETREALAQQTATAEVLGVINASPGDLAPVFDAILEKANYLCETAFGVLWTYDGTDYFPGAIHAPQAFIDAIKDRPRPPANGGTLYRHAAGEQVVHIEDMAGETGLYETNSTRRVFVDLGGGRSALSVALHKDGALFGALQVYRQEVRPFSEKQIALLQNFAVQAVIAMENARLLTETREALDQQTATAEVLQVINSSPGDLSPVFDAMLQNALRLCEARLGMLYTFDGESFHMVGHRGVAPTLAEVLREPVRTRDGNLPTRGSFGRLLLGEPVVHDSDVADTEGYRLGMPVRKALVDIGGARTGLWVALRKDDKVLGVVVLYRQEVRPFSSKQIVLLQNFAAQAVIAMENARLITETREALDQQTATAEVLGVINSSPGDLAPVFDAMLEKAMHLCGAAFGGLWTFDGDRYVATTLRGVPDAYAEFLAANTMIPGPGSAPYRYLHGERSVIQNIDLAAEENYRRGDPQRLALVDLGGARTALQMPLYLEDRILGVITLYRKEVIPFTDKQIALLRNFAAQAVIAMENARLITETREALEQQTATAEVLQVINSSPGDLTPVFDAILEKAHLLCGAAVGALFLYDGEKVRAAAVHGYPEDVAETLRNGIRPPPPLLDGARMFHRHDVREDADPVGRLISQRGGVRTNLLIPLRKDGVFLGMISCNRQEVRPYSDKEISLIENFATQAVIAIENARLLDEIRQRQAELRVTFDNMADGVVMFDEDLRLAAWNRNFQELLDVPDAVLAERPNYADYLRILAERGEFGTDDIEAELSRRLAEAHQELRVERTRPDGRVIEVRRNAVPDGGFVLIYSDITERKRSEAEIRAARDAAEATLRDLRAVQANLIQAEKMASLGQLTAGIAHEIKNPLNFVNNFAGLSVELLDELKETAAPGIASLDDDKRAEIDETVEMLTGNLEKIAEHGRRADNIVKSMLEHSRGVSGERREIDLNGLIEEALNLAYHGARAQDQSFNITMEREFDRGIQAIELAPQEITRVFLNLFGNGFYAANKRARGNGDASFRPTLTVSTRDLDGEAVEIRVRDNGTGIPPEIRDKLFQPFFTTKPTGEGTGLGLSISYDIVTQQHGGTIEVDSRVDEFTEFTVRLPRGFQASAAA